MLITKFHMMIRHRVVWAIIATLVSLTFLFSFSSMDGCTNAGQAQNNAGLLYGKPVSHDEFQQAMFFEMGLGSDRTKTAEEYASLHQQTWRRLAILRSATRMGINVPDEEIGQILNQEKGFLSNGVFDKERYRAFVTERGVDIPTFEAYLRQNITIQKVLGILESASWTAPSDLDHRLRNLTDVRVLEYIAFNQDQFTGIVEITEADARTFYQTNRDYFTIPERVRVRYVAFPYTGFITTNAISDTDAQDYYDLHASDFLAPESTNAYAMPEPLEKVRPTIDAILRQQTARFAAREHATTFVMDLAPDRAGNRPAFDTLAAARNLPVSTTGLFTADEVLPDLEVDGEFNRAAFNLVANDPQFSFSDSISGSNAVYVMTIDARQESRVPGFEEITGTVTPLALSNAQQRAFHTWVGETRNALADAVAAKQNFKTAAKALGLTTITTTNFTVLASLNTNVFADAEFVVEPIIELDQDAVGEPVTAGSRGFIIYQVGREPGNPSDMYALRPQLTRMLQEYSTRMVFADWGQQLLKEAQFQDFSIQTNAVPDEAESPTPGS